MGGADVTTNEMFQHKDVKFTKDKIKNIRINLYSTVCKVNLTGKNFGKISF